MKQKDKLKFMTILAKIFSVCNFIMTWYANAQEDHVITKEELAELGLGICEVLGLKTDINLK